MLSRPVWGAWIEISKYPQTANNAYWSRPVWGAWIEIEMLRRKREQGSRRAPYGARGLKYTEHIANKLLMRSRAPYGARGLKLFCDLENPRFVESRAPYGARGLKSVGAYGEL